MIKNFDEVKRQLGELSDVVNKFKSEQVQLKIVELIFRGDAGDSVGQGNSNEQHASPKPARRTRRSKSKHDGGTEGGDGKRRSAMGTGPMSTLEQFIDEGFFGQKRTIGAVVEHCKTKARNFKNNELSGPLGRLVRANKLSRSKNNDDQWEYSKK